MAEIVIEGAKTSHTFNGTLIASETMDDGSRPRWAEFALYTRDGGGYVVVTGSRSLVYHQLDGPCRNRDQTQPGQPTEVRAMPDNAEPCRNCEPPWPDEMLPATKVRYETPKYTVRYVRTAGDAVRVLTTDSRTGKTRWSAPVTRLLDKAADADEAFASVSRPESSVVIE